MIPILLLLLGCLMVYAGTIEAAFSAIMRLSLRLIAERNGRDDLLKRYLDDPVLLFIPVRLLLGLIFALTAVLLAVNIEREGESLHGLLLLFVSVACFVVVCEHLVPALIVRRDPKRVLDFLLPSFEVWVRILTPVTLAVVRVGPWGWERAGAASPSSDHEGQAVGERTETDTNEGVQLIEREGRRLLQSIVNFGDILVREVMTPRPDIVAIESDATLDELRALFREQEYSRLPVYKENLDNILGFIFVKDLIQLVDAGGDERRITGLMRPAHFVPETKRVVELLREFQQRQVQSAIVVDEYGGTAGLVTIEDLLEEIVGEIRDEYDVESEPIVDEGNGSFVFSAKVNISDVAERLGVQIEREGFETVGGYVLSRVGRVPAVGEVLDIDELSVEVLEAERRRVHKVRLRRRQAVAEATDEV